MTSSAVRELLKAAKQPGVISIAGGLLASELLPTDAAQEASQRVLAKRGQEALQYGLTEGYSPLCAWIVEYMARLGAPIDEDNVLNELVKPFMLFERFWNYPDFPWTVPTSGLGWMPALDETLPS